MSCAFTEPPACGSLAARVERLCIHDMKHMCTSVFECLHVCIFVCLSVCTFVKSVWRKNKSVHACEKFAYMSKFDKRRQRRVARGLSRIDPVSRVARRSDRVLSACDYFFPAAAHRNGSGARRHHVCAVFFARQREGARRRICHDRADRRARHCGAAADVVSKLGGSGDQLAASFSDVQLLE